MIDWLERPCKDWGACTRYLLAETNEGFPGRDPIQKAREGMLSLGEGTINQHFPEVRLGDALAIQRTLVYPSPMPLDFLAVLWTYYVAKGPVTQKLIPLSHYLHRPLELKDFWHTIDRAHWFIAGRWESPDVVKQRQNVSAR